MSAARLNEQEREIMEHALGVGRSKEPPGWRNYYCAGIGGADEKAWSALVVRGLARRTGNMNAGRDAVFAVTDAGREALGLPPTKDTSR